MNAVSRSLKKRVILPASINLARSHVIYSNYCSDETVTRKKQNVCTLSQYLERKRKTNIALDVVCFLVVWSRGDGKNSYRKTRGFNSEQLQTRYLL